jgi:1,4-dihydroxy-2-naphthoate octaprenyltransferase
MLVRFLGVRLGLEKSTFLYKILFVFNFIFPFVSSLLGPAEWAQAWKGQGG